MDTILNIDNTDTKKVDITNTSGGNTGSIDFVSDNNSDNQSTKSLNISSPLNSPMAKPNLGVSDTMGIDILSSKPAEPETNLFSTKSDPVVSETTAPQVPDDKFMMNQPDNEFKP